MPTFPERLRKARLAQGLSQKQLATQSGMRAPMVCHCESGQREPSLDAFLRMCQALEIDPSMLLVGEKTRRPCPHCHGKGWLYVVAPIEEVTASESLVSPG